jgi:ATP-dependent RNA helicase CshB
MKPIYQEMLTQLGFAAFTPVQEAVIPVLDKHQSVVVTSQTGSGKTLSFLMPLVQQLDDNDRLQAIIISPTKELADQLLTEARKLQAIKPFSIGSFTGGTVPKTAKINVLVGTPGKLEDVLVKQNTYDLRHVKLLIIDEADMTLDAGFLQSVDQVAGRLPKTLQMGVFSATIPKGLQPFLKRYLNNPQVISIEKNTLELTHQLYRVNPAKRLQNLVELVATLQPFVGMIFCNTKQDVIMVKEAIEEHVENVAMVHGDIPARARKQIMRRIKDHEFQFVVCSDIAARGIDIPDVSHVINYQFPKDLSFYTHRAGRTGRIGKTGIVISLFDSKEEGIIQALQQQGVKFEKR